MGRLKNSKHLSVERKKMIVQLYSTRTRAGQRRTQADVAYDLGVSLSTVEKVLKRYRDTGSVELEKRSIGRPRSLTVQEVDVSGLVFLARQLMISTIFCSGLLAKSDIDRTYTCQSSRRH